MAETAPNQESAPLRQRPTHWTHPVDEAGRSARARRHRRRRIAAILALVLVGLAVAAWYWLTSDERVEAFAESYLEDLLGTKVRIERASFSLSEGLRLEGLGVEAPPPFQEPLLVAQRVDMKIDLVSLLRLSPRVSEIVVLRPQINLVLWDEKEWNFQALARLRPPALEAPSLRPVVVLNEGRLRVRRKLGGETVYEQQLAVSGLLLPSETDPGTLRFQTDVRSKEVHLSVASGEVNALSGRLRFEGQASNVALNPELYRSLPGEVQRIWDRFEPSGSINVKILFDERTGFRLVTEMTGVRFTTEYNGQDYAFENLTGRCAFSASTLGLEGVQGLVNGTPLRLDGEVSGFDRPVLAMNLAVVADHVDLQEHRDVLLSVAPHLESVYRVYSPRGPADLDLTIRRGPEAGDPLEVSGTLFCRDMEMTYLHFPYRLERIRGAIRFSPREYVIVEDEALPEAERGIVGRHGPARVRLTGWAKNPGPTVESRIRVRGTDVPLDEDLRQALAEKQRAVYDQYRPGGVADIDVDIYRPPHAGARPEVIVDLKLRDGRFAYEGFPYALEHAAGEIVIAPGRTQIMEVRGRHGEASVTVSGEIDTSGDGPPSVDLKVAGQDVPLDDDLAAALPERERAVLAVFHLSGLADVEGTVRRSAETKGALDYDLAIRLKKARMIYEPFPFLAEDVSGTLRLASGACRIEKLTGYNAGARIDATGSIEQRADDYAMDLVLTGKDVTLGESLRGALGPDIRSVWSHISPRGRVDLQAHLTKAFGPGEVLKHHVWVTAHDVQAQLDVFPYPLEHVEGQMEFVGSEVRLHDLRARTGLTEFVLAGRIAYAQPDAGPELDLVLQTRGLRFEGPLRDALPAPLQKAFALIRPTGRVDLNLESLRYRPATPDRPAEAEWRGSAILDEVGAEPGLRIADIVGTADVQGRWTEGKVWLKGGMQIQQGTVADKAIANTRLVIEKPEDKDVADVQSIEGEFYGGRIEGFATIGLTGSGRYAINLAVQDVDFARLLREGLRLEHTISGGRLRATLGLRATGPDAATVEASGAAYVTEADLYKTPLIVKILNALSLGSTDETAFHNARILYFLRGKRMILGDVRLEGDALNLYGAGVMEADGQLDLVFLVGKKNDNPLIPALYELMEGIRRQIAVVYVTGTLADPRVETRTLEAVSEPVRAAVTLMMSRGRSGGGEP
jgi:hypothetical protein